MVKVLQRHAFTMIELVFAIVIIGIAVSVIPTVISSNNKNESASIVSEGVFALSAQMMQDSTYYWDVNSKDSVSNGANVLDITTSVGEYNRTAPSDVYRVGHATDAQPQYHRHFFASSTAPAGSALSDGIGTGTGNLITTTASGGYKRTYTYSRIVSFVSESTIFSKTQTATQSNIKMLEYELKDSGGTSLAVMRNYVSNIGEAEYYRVLK